MKKHKFPLILKCLGMRRYPNSEEKEFLFNVLLAAIAPIVMGIVFDFFF